MPVSKSARMPNLYGSSPLLVRWRHLHVTKESITKQYTAREAMVSWCRDVFIVSQPIPCWWRRLACEQRTKCMLPSCLDLYITNFSMPLQYLISLCIIVFPYLHNRMNFTITTITNILTKQVARKLTYELLQINDNKYRIQLLVGVGIYFSVVYKMKNVIMQINIIPHC